MRWSYKYIHDLYFCTLYVLCSESPWTGELIEKLCDVVTKTSFIGFFHRFFLHIVLPLWLFMFCFELSFKWDSIVHSYKWKEELIISATSRFNKGDIDST